MADGGDRYHAYLPAEQKARVEIDEMLTEAGWALQDHGKVSLGAAAGVAVREVPMKAGHGQCDYLLFVDGKAAGVIEAKAAGTTLTGVEWQSEKYAHGLPDHVRGLMKPLPFAYESTGRPETRFTNGLDPEPASRRVFAFHRPETIRDWFTRWQQSPDGPETATFRQRLNLLPELDPMGLWPAQATAIRNVEHSLQEYRPRALIQMATGSGKTFTAANIAYRLIKHADAKRVLFLVDRANLGRQTLREFQAFVTPDDGRKLTELYNVQHLTSGSVDPVARVTISTVQRLYAALRGEELAEDDDERSGFDAEPAAPVDVAYNADIPIEAFDVVIVDECHRSIYGVWRQVLEYFDAFQLGLTATPGKQTFGYFNQNLVMEYGHEEAVADNVNVDFDVYRIRTRIAEQGSTVDAGLVTQFRDRETRAIRLEKLDEDYEYDEKALDRTVVARDQIRTIVKTFRAKLPEIFPGRTHVPKTLIFAKSDAHADDIVDILREEFGKGNDFAKKITYRSGSQGQKPEDLLASFRNSYDPRIAVTVDMIATGTDVKPLECVFFMRGVKSRNFFEQMKGRGVRVVDSTTLRGVTPDAIEKDRFVIVDAVGVTESDLSDTVPLERKRGVSFESLLNALAYGDRSEETISSIAARLSRLNARISDADRAELEELAGAPLVALAHHLVEALDADAHLEAAQAATGEATPAPDALAIAREIAFDVAAGPIADNPDLRQALADVNRTLEQLIDEVSKDEVTAAEWDVDAADRARRTVESFRQYIEDHKDEITALEILYDRPFAARLTFPEVKELARAIERPPHRWTPERLWAAYETLDKSKVRGAPGTVLTNLVSLVRFAIEAEDELVPYPALVEERFAGWLAQQEQTGRTFTPEQMVWLERIRDHVAASLAISTDDFEYVPFTEHGGLGKAVEVFGDDLALLLDELNDALVA